MPRVIPASVAVHGEDDSSRERETWVNWIRSFLSRALPPFGRDGARESEASHPALGLLFGGGAL